MHIDMLSAFAMYAAAVIGILLGAYTGLSILSSYRKNRYERKIRKMKKIDMEIQDDRKRAVKESESKMKKRILKSQKQSAAISHNNIVEETQGKGTESSANMYTDKHISQSDTGKENEDNRSCIYQKWGTAKNHNSTVEKKRGRNIKKTIKPHAGIGAASGLFRKAATAFTDESAQEQPPQKSHIEMQNPLRQKHDAPNLLRQVAEENGAIGSDVSIDCEEQGKDVVETVRENMSAQERAYKNINRKNSSK